MSSRFVAIGFGLLMLMCTAAGYSGHAVATPDSNNDLSDAVQVFNNYVIVESLDVSDDTSDFYKIYLHAGEWVDAYLEVPYLQDFDLCLYGESQTVLSYSVIDNPMTGSYYEEVNASVTSTGWYYVEVAAYAGSGMYALWITATAEWTIMLYLDGDCNLEADAITDFLEVSSIGSTPEVNLVVQLDRWHSSGDPADDTRYGDWTGCERFFVTQGMAPELSNSYESLGEVNMGDPQTLVDFGNRAIHDFPAHKYALCLWDHGGSWQGICWDDSRLPALDRLTMPELSSALSIIVTTNELPSLDVVWFDACNMASIEVAYQISDYCTNMVGSEKVVPDTGANYALTLSALESNPTMTSSAFSAQIVSDYVDSYDATPEPGYLEDNVTKSASTMNQIQPLVESVNALATELKVNMTSYVNYVRLSWEEAEYYDEVYTDLGDLAWKMKQYMPVGQVRTLAQSIMDGVNATVSAEGHWDLPGGDVIANASGLTVYFPESAYYDPAYHGGGVNFADYTQWDEFLAAYYSKVWMTNSPPSILTWEPTSNPTIDEGQSQTFSVTASDSDGNALSSTWYLDGAPFSQDSLSAIYAPWYSDAGLHTLEVVLWDGDLSESHSWTINVTDVDFTPPSSVVGSISPYWAVSGPMTVSATARDTGGPVANVTLMYRFSSDNFTWNEWTEFGLDPEAPWEWAFGFGEGNGYYEFCAFATDLMGNEEQSLSTTEALCAYDDQPPSAVFEVVPALGDIVTVFEVDASECSDFKDTVDSLECRWDWDNDGVWDTGWSTSKTAFHQFSSSGDFLVRLEVRDTDRMVNSTTVVVHVLAVVPEFETAVVPILGVLVLIVAVGVLRGRERD